jgi:hypothetical protein
MLTEIVMPTDTIFLIRPASFGFNAQTEASNAFQKKSIDNREVIMEKALKEFDAFVEKLRNKGVNVEVYDDTSSPEKPDAIFPNNWISLHEDGKLILYPMLAENRRAERRGDIINSLKERFVVTHILDLSKYEQNDKFLEGTGSIVFDQVNKIAYACMSPRTNKELFIKVCGFLNYKPMYFSALDKNGKDIYHTNVIMCLGERFAIACADCVVKEDRDAFIDSLANKEREIIQITFEQMEKFAGNMLALNTNDGKSILVLSQTAFDSLSEIQKDNLNKYSELFPLSINTIEAIGGGSARCLIGEIFLKRK